MLRYPGEISVRSDRKSQRDILAPQPIPDRFEQGLFQKFRVVSGTAWSGFLKVCGQKVCGQGLWTQGL